jgi:hypothetical protein
MAADLRNSQLLLDILILRSLTRLKVQAVVSTPAARQAKQPLPFPGSPVHLILRFLHREHYPGVSNLPLI